MFRLPLWIVLAALLPTPAAAVQEDADVTDQFVVAEGLSVTLWAESPLMYNPTAMDVDARGRLWVAEAVDYRRWSGRNGGFEREGGDRIVILEDTNGNGRCDSSKVFVQDEDLVAPMGVLVQGSRVYVSCSPNLFVYHDDDGDDRADRREIVLTGFGGHDHDHGLHSAVVAPDGRLVMAVGNAGPHLVTDRSGWKLRSGSMYTGGGSRPADNKPGLVSDDGRVWVGGLVLSATPDGDTLRVLAHNFRNNYEVALDSYGNLFQSDNDDDGNQGCRTLWLMAGGNHGYFSADGSRSWQADARPGQDKNAAQWHQDDPGVVPAGTINGAGGPTGVAVYEGELMRRWLAGAVLNADAGRNVVYAHRPGSHGAGIRLEAGELIRAKKSAEPRANWFRPSDVTVGLDGSVFVADWYDPGVGGHLMRDTDAFGRIYRISPRSAPAGAQPIDPSTPRGALEALRSPVPSVRALGAATVRRLGRGALPIVQSLLDDRRPKIRARGLWLAVHLGGLGRSMVVQALGDRQPQLRIAALRSLRGAVPDMVVNWATRLAGDSSAAVRREVALSLRDIPVRTAAAAWLRLAKELDPKDRFAVEAMGIGADGQESELYGLLVDPERDPLTWSETLAALAWRLHPAEAVASLRARALAGNLTTKARQQAIDALAFIPSRTAATAMVDIAQVGPEDLRSSAAWWLRHRSSHDWSRFGLSTAVAAGSRENATRVFDSDVMRMGRQSFDVDVSGAARVWLVVTEGGNGHSCDWADWIDPRFVTETGEVPLTRLSWVSAEAGWGTVGVDRNAGGGELAIGGQKLSGIGTHAASEIVYEVPSGASRLRGEVGPDDGGTSQNGGSQTSVSFEIWVEVAEDPTRWAELEASLLDASLDATERGAAARALALDPRGALRILRRARAGELPEALRSEIETAIFQNPDVSIRGLASEFFQRPGNLGAKLPPIRDLLALPGNVGAGRSLFLSEKAQCSTCHVIHGRGGDIGPDLSQVHTKYRPAELLDHILNPSAGIAHGYETYLIVTEDEQYLTGFLLADGDPVILKDTQGKRHILPADTIAARERQAVSTMPEGVALGLTSQELADLTAFLAEDPSSPPELGEPIALFDGQTFNGWTHHLSDSEASFESVWSIEDGVIRCTGRPAGYLRTEADYTNFVLTLEWRFDPAKGPGNSGVLLRMTGPDKVWPKSIEAQLQHQNAGDIWNIDLFGMEVDSRRTQGRRTLKRQPTSENTMGEWNRYEITLDRGELRLEVNGILQNTASWCDEMPGKICLQSEGATIEFRNIELRPILR